jgi:hypothetical protein
MVFLPKKSIISTRKHPTNTLRIWRNQPINSLNPKKSPNH